MKKSKIPHLLCWTSQVALNTKRIAVPLLWGLDIDIRLVRTFTLLPAGSFSTKGEAGFFHSYLFGDHEGLKLSEDQIQSWDCQWSRKIQLKCRPLVWSEQTWITNWQLAKRLNREQNCWFVQTVFFCLSWSGRSRWLWCGWLQIVVLALFRLTCTTLH